MLAVSHHCDEYYSILSSHDSVKLQILFIGEENEVSRDKIRGHMT
jgi:hypothetical protein